MPGARRRTLVELGARLCGCALRPAESGPRPNRASACAALRRPRAPPAPQRRPGHPAGTDAPCAELSATPAPRAATGLATRVSARHGHSRPPKSPEHAERLLASSLDRLGHERFGRRYDAGLPGTTVAVASAPGLGRAGSTRCTVTLGFAFASGAGVAGAGAAGRSTLAGAARAMAGRDHRRVERRRGSRQRPAGAARRGPARRAARRTQRRQGPCDRLASRRTRRPTPRRARAIVPTERARPAGRASGTLARIRTGTVSGTGAGGGSVATVGATLGEATLVVTGGTGAGGNVERRRRAIPWTGKVTRGRAAGGGVRSGRPGAGGASGIDGILDGRALCGFSTTGVP